MQIESTIFTFMTQFTRKNIFKCCLLLNRMPNYPYRMPCTIFSCFFFVIRKKIIEVWAFFCQKLPFLPQNAWFFFLKSKNGVLETFLKSNILCTKILGTVKFFLKSQSFRKSYVLKSKIHCIKIAFPNFFDWLFLIRACWNPKSRQGPNLGYLG